jgi:hypothetical protein
VCARIFRWMRAEFYKKENRSAVIQVRAANLTGRVNILNFNSLFSGSAVAVPRSVSARLHLIF